MINKGKGCFGSPFSFYNYYDKFYLRNLIILGRWPVIIHRYFKGKEMAVCGYGGKILHRRKTSHSRIVFR